jgi:hypothetical protein
LTRRTVLKSSLLVPAFAGLGLAQEGFPLAGTWHGSWGPNATERHDITLVIMWDGKTITGLINPGPDAGHLQNTTLDSSQWMVHLEGDPKDSKGARVKVVADGKLQNITNRRRFITGTWTEGSVKGDFKITRDD